MVPTLDMQAGLQPATTKTAELPVSTLDTKDCGRRRKHALRRWKRLGKSNQTVVLRVFGNGGRDRDRTCDPYHVKREAKVFADFSKITKIVR